MVNDLRVCERLASLEAAAWQRRPAEMRCRHFLGVKWSQVQILSARPEKTPVRGLLTVDEASDWHTRRGCVPNRHPNQIRTPQTNHRPSRPATETSHSPTDPSADAASSWLRRFALRVVQQT